MSTTYIPDFNTDTDTFPIDYEEEPEDVSTGKPIQFVCPKCGLTIEGQEITIFNAISDSVFDGVEDTKEGNYFLDTGKCLLCETELERRYV